MHSKSQKGNVHVAKVTWKTTVNINTTGWGQNGRVGGGGVVQWLPGRTDFHLTNFREMGRCVKVYQCTHMYIWKEPIGAANWGGGCGVFDLRGQKRTQAGEQGQTNSICSCIKAYLSCGTPYHMGHKSCVEWENVLPGRAYTNTWGPPLNPAGFATKLNLRI